ncbi:MAG TPA: DUF4395 domain-containing protein [Saprospiraceae bacterium]|nr:DUF4395 domain-containing protein [Saprospiraceae bacterium]
MFEKIICPVSTEKVDSHVSRLTVFFQVILLTYFLFTLQPIPLYLVTIDYGIRALGYNQYSLLCFLAGFIIRLIGLAPKMTNKAPKVFASRLGFICGLLGSVFITLQMPLAAFIIIGMLTLLAILDSVLDFCVGCIIYNYLVLPFYNRT